MPDLLHIIPHPDEQRTYAELREEFRSVNLQRIRDEFSGHHPVGWNMIGDSSNARDRYIPSEWAREMMSRLDAPVVQEFGMTAYEDRYSERIEKQAQASMSHDDVTWEEGTDGTVDRDAPACSDVLTMADDELSEYVDRSIRESARG